MQLSLLLVEDEPGIREGLSSFLQLKGYRVIAAESCTEGLRRIAEGEFDLVITDWHLGDGLGEQIAEASHCPVLVISGVAECITLDDCQVEVIRKPVMPPDLIKKIESMLPQQSPVELMAGRDEADELPIDAQDRVALLRALVRSRQEIAEDAIRIIDDGTFVSVEVLLDHEDDCLQASIGRIGGDVRCLDREGRPLLELRFFRSCQRRDSDRLLGPNEPWPEDQSAIAVDFSRSQNCSPSRVVELLDRVRAARESGRVAYFLNVPTHLRLHLELLGKAHAMPMRDIAGPALPAILTELWR